MNYNEFRNEVDALQGNINRMCVTNNLHELVSMRDWADRRIDKIYSFLADRIDLSNQLGSFNPYSED
ncbi:hypothetical protein FACS189490_07920 [Clostridia bacterium]|nr:hypothetical protein FACS189490_07920 [Clostridia bacterium]